jgi:type VI secretion system FHA domain protein
MTLTLNMLRCPDAVAPQTRTVTGGEFAIGRGPENDWALPDPQRVLSKRHCLLAYRSGGWQIADVSTNGTFLNAEAAPIGRGQPRELRDGDRLRLGAYEIEVRIVESAALPPTATGTANPFALDPFASPPKASRGPLEEDPLLHGGLERDPFAAGLVPPSINLPPDYDPLVPDPPEAPFAGPTQRDHSPHLEDAFRPAAVRPVLPEDWDREPAPLQPSSAAVAPAQADPPPVPPPSLETPVPGEVAAPAEDRLLAAFRSRSACRPSAPSSGRSSGADRRRR